MAETRQLGEHKRRVQPLCAVYEEQGRIVLTLEMPGIGKDDLSIDVENDELRIRGIRQGGARDGRFLVRERSVDDYYQVFTLDDSIDRDKIQAHMQKGVLSVYLEQKESSKPRQIQVREIG